MSLAHWRSQIGYIDICRWQFSLTSTLCRNTRIDTLLQSTHTLTHCACSYGAVTWSFWQLQRRAWGLIITFSPLEEKNISFRLQLSLSLTRCLSLALYTQLQRLSKWGFGIPRVLEAVPGRPLTNQKFNLIQFSWNDPSYRMYKKEFSALHIQCSQFWNSILNQQRSSHMAALDEILSKGGLWTNVGLYGGLWHEIVWEPPTAASCKSERREEGGWMRDREKK